MILRKRAEPLRQHVRHNLDVAVTATGCQHLRRLLPICVSDTEAERTIEFAALDQASTHLATARRRASSPIPSPITRRHRSWIVNSPLSETLIIGSRDSTSRPDRRHARRSPAQQRGVTTADGGGNRQRLSLIVIEVIEHRLEHVLLRPDDPVGGSHRRSRRPPSRRRRDRGFHTVQLGQREHLRHRDSRAVPRRSRVPLPRLAVARALARGRDWPHEGIDDGALRHESADASGLPRRVWRRGVRRRR